MSFIKCPFCGERITDKTLTCVHCGKSLKIDSLFIEKTLEEAKQFYEKQLVSLDDEEKTITLNAYNSFKNRICIEMDKAKITDLLNKFKEDLDNLPTSIIPSSCFTSIYRHPSILKHFSTFSLQKKIKNDLVRIPTKYNSLMSLEEYDDRDELEYSSFSHENLTFVLGDNIKKVCNLKFDKSPSFYFESLPESIDFISTANEITFNQDISVASGYYILCNTLKLYNTTFEKLALSNHYISCKFLYINDVLIEKQSDVIIEEGKNTGLSYLSFNRPDSIVFKTKFPASYLNSSWLLQEVKAVTFFNMNPEDVYWDFVNHCETFNFNNVVYKKNGHLFCKYSSFLSQNILQYYNYPTFLIDDSGTVIHEMCIEEKNDFVFSNLKGVYSITLKNMPSLPRGCFKDCTDLKKIVLDERVANIPDDCFYRCENLEEVIGPEELDSVGESAFKWCKNLKFLSFLNNINCINEDAFLGCESLFNSEVEINCKELFINCFEECKIEKLKLISDETFVLHMPSELRLGIKEFCVEAPEIKFNDIMSFKNPCIEVIEIPRISAHFTGELYCKNLKQIFINDRFSTNYRVGEKTYSFLWNYAAIYFIDGITKYKKID